jgi:hypothetical protein
VAEGLVVELPDVRLSWEGDPVQEAVSDGELDWGRWQLLRVIRVAFEDGATLLVAATRPVGSPAHGDEAVGATLGLPDLEPIRLAEAFVSTEYDADGLPRRLGLELYKEAEPIPLRIAADTDEVREDGPRTVAAMRFRMNGVPGHGIYELVRAR